MSISFWTISVPGFDESFHTMNMALNGILKSLKMREKVAAMCSHLTMIKYISMGQFVSR